MKKAFLTFALLASVLFVRADLNVEWIDDNTIVVSGIGDGYVVTNVVTNAYGSCTNCVNISPDQLRQYKSDILSSCDDADYELELAQFSLSAITTRCMVMQDEIPTFRRIASYPGGTSPTQSQLDEYTNYVYSVDNTQTRLDISHSGSRLRSSASVSYNNGVYDYATGYVLPMVQDTYNDSVMVYSNVDTAKSKLVTIRNVVNSMSEEPCECSGGSCSNSNSSASGDCPCAEQMDAILDYVKHIDDDFHVQLENMADVTNFIPRMDAYAKTVSGVLYNNGTIVVDDGDNSWSNVYRRGESDLYDYDKSNILQRIELLVFGLTSLSSSTNWGHVGDVESDVVDVQYKMDEIDDVISENHETIKGNINTIKGKLQSLFNTLNFFGAGSLSEFALTDPFTVSHFGNYTIEVRSSNVDSLQSLRNVFRTCFQVFYWVSGICFMIAFWYWIISFTIKHVLMLLRFFNQLLT